MTEQERRKPRRGPAFCIAAFLVLAVVLTAGILSEPRFVGYLGTQPKLTVRLEPGSTAGDRVGKVCGAAKAYFATRFPAKARREFWPEPTAVSEFPDHWWVKFKWKEQVYRKWGQEYVRHSCPGVMTVRVEKSDLSCSLVPAR